jgi:hypothetical protein
MQTLTQNDLTAMVRRLIGDPSTPTAVRNECHRLLIAMEGNHRALIDETVERLGRLTEVRTGTTAVTRVGT